jgi:NTE family protein
MFGAWQAGAWAALSQRFTPDLIVGASVGSLNGYMIASGATPEDLRRMWLDPEIASFSRLRANLRDLTGRFSPRIDFAVTVTELRRMKPKIVRGAEITHLHLEASCAVPLVMRQVRIGGRLYSDGGLLNPLPVYAAVELGATGIIGLNALPEIPSKLLKPFVLGFRGVFGVNPPVPGGVDLRVLKPGRRLGAMRDALKWSRANIEAWFEQGFEDAEKHFPSDLF